MPFCPVTDISCAKPCAAALLKTEVAASRLSLWCHLKLSGPLSSHLWALCVIFAIVEQALKGPIKFTCWVGPIGNDMGANTRCHFTTKCTNKKFYNQQRWTFTWTFVPLWMEQSFQGSVDICKHDLEQAIIYKSFILLSIFSHRFFYS